jgi:hypothetical protein
MSENAIDSENISKSALETAKRTFGQFSLDCTEERLAAER